MKWKYITAAVTILFFVGTTLFYCYYEKWSVIDSILFVVSTVTTVGFGYDVPSSDGSRVFTMFVILFGVLFILKVLLDMMYYLLLFVQRRTATTLRWLFIYSLLLVLIVLVGGAVSFSYLQDISFITGLYFAIETSTTLGLGDIPVNSNTKVFLIFYVVVSTLVIAFAFENFTTMRPRIALYKKKQRILLNETDFVAIVDQARRVMASVEFKRNTDEKHSELTFFDGDGVKIGQYQFVVCVLAHLGSINVEKEVVPWLKKFNELDINNCGYLTKEQLSQMTKRTSEPVETEVLANESRRRSNSHRNNTTKRTIYISTDNENVEEELEEESLA